MIRLILEYLRRKKATDSSKNASPQDQPAGAGRKTGKMKLLIGVLAGVAVCAVGFVGSVTFLSSIKTTKEPPLQMKLASNLPKQSVPASQPGSHDMSQQPGVVYQSLPQSPGMPPQASKDAPGPQTPAPVGMAKQEQPAYIAKREVNTRPVSEVDPFKSEFQKKYEDAEKKDKKPRGKNGTDASLSELEKSLKAKPLMPVAQIPPPLPIAKDLKLSIHGVVLSKGGDSYALTDRGVIKVGSNVESFRVEKIDVDTVTLKSRDNEKDVRNFYITAKTTQAGASGAVTPIVPR
jgi:hypothetical protein